VLELAGIQRQALNSVAGSVKPGGRLIYSVCTLTRAETTDVSSGFSATHPEFTPAPVVPSNRAPGSAEAGQSPPLTSDPAASGSVFLWPHELNSNGMFIAAWRKQA
jgi:16S rRNA (cytosine967-C5)-methyltransferase